MLLDKLRIFLHHIACLFHIELRSKARIDLTKIQNVLCHGPLVQSKVNFKSDLIPQNFEISKETMQLLFEYSLIISIDSS